MRCISFTFGSNILELDLSNSSISYIHIELLFANIRKLKILRINNCQEVDGNCMNKICKFTGPSVKEIHAKNCKLFSTEPLLWMSGCIGLGAPKMNKLNLIDFSDCPLLDPGLTAVVSCNNKLKYVNLQNCSELSDKSIVNLIQHNGKTLELLNVTGCTKLTNKVAFALATHCPNIASINLNKCREINDAGVEALTTKCSKIQALNLSGLYDITESTLHSIALHCKNILMLNVTGCEGVTSSGLKTLILGLKYVEQSISFVGFKPIDEHVNKKLEEHLIMVKTEALLFLEQNMKAKKKKDHEQEMFMHRLQVKSSNTIKQYMSRYLKRVFFWYIYHKKKVKRSIIDLQRVYRGYRGRLRAGAKKEEWARFWASSPLAIKIQKVVRGHLWRLSDNCQNVFKALRDMYLARRQEAEAGIAVRFQAKARRYLAFQRVKAWREVCRRRHIDEQNAILILQMLVRRFLAKITVARIRFNKLRMDALHYKCATVIAKFYRRQMALYISKLQGKDLQKIMRKTWVSSMLIQRNYRGFRSRERVRRLRIGLAVQYAAAVVIQKMFRGARVMYWRDMRLNVIAAFVLDRQYIERKDRIASSRLRYQAFLNDVRRDSASDEEDVTHEDVEWEKRYDEDRKKWYWYNDVDKVITFDEPKVEYVSAKAMMYKRIKVYWVALKVWYEGTITQYHRKKARHRIDYDDGDHEWIDLHAEMDRVQVLQEDGSWIMYHLYQPPEILNEWNKIEVRKKQENFKKVAWEDAQQWSVVPCDQVAGSVMFVSDRSGELRAGVTTAQDWVIQDDGFGFPCFANIHTGDVVHEDPRFMRDDDADLSSQRDYVMAELRYSLYFCREYWDRYSNALALNDQRQIAMIQNEIRVSQKPKHLAGMVIRAKALYKRTSVLDSDIHAEVNEELEFATWMSSRMAEIIHEATANRRKRAEKKVQVIAKLTKKSGLPITCPKCGKETKKHMEFCPHCGRKQGVTYMYHLSPREKGAGTLAPIEEH